MSFNQYFELVKRIGEIDWDKTNGGELVESDEYKSLTTHFEQGTDNFAHYKFGSVSILFGHCADNLYLDAWLQDRTANGVLSWEDLEDLWDHATHASKDILSAQILFPHPDNDHDKQFFQDMDNLAHAFRWILDIYPERKRFGYDIVYRTRS